MFSFTVTTVTWDKLLRNTVRVETVQHDKNGEIEIALFTGHDYIARAADYVNSNFNEYLDPDQIIENYRA